MVYTGKQSCPFKKADIHTENGLIKKVIFNPEDRLQEELEKYKIISCDDLVALPGFIDAHTHLVQTFARGLMESLSLGEWLERIWTYRLSPEECYYSTLFGALEAIKTGTTTVCDMITQCTSPTEVVRAIRDSGLRACISLAVSDFKEGKHTPSLKTEEALRKTEEFVKKYHLVNEGRITVKLSPVGLPAVTLKLLREMRKLAGKYKVGFHLHACEGEKQTRISFKRFNKSEIEVLFETGNLGADVQLAHTIWISKEDLELLTRTETNVVQCPSSNIKLADGVTPITEMQTAGVNTALGCDGAASSSSYDLLLEGRIASFQQKLEEKDVAAAPPAEIIKMLTENGAKAAGISELGKLKPGWKADITFVNIAQLHIFSLDKAALLANLVFSATGKDVAMTVVNGEVLYRDGQFTRFNEKEIFEKGKKFLKSKGGSIK